MQWAAANRSVKLAEAGRPEGRPSRPGECAHACYTPVTRHKLPPFPQFYCNPLFFATDMVPAPTRYLRRTMQMWTLSSHRGGLNHHSGLAAG